eukprot:6299218-Karenia_brevis.AAC.1
MKVAWSVENPERSYMWDTSWFLTAMKKLNTMQSLASVSYHACMHGGTRDKACKLWYWGVDLSPLRTFCDKSHAHKPWGLLRSTEGNVFATAEERRYPHLFCSRLAKMVAKELGPIIGPVASGKAAIHVQPRRGANEM